MNVLTNYYDVKTLDIIQASARQVAKNNGIDRSLANGGHFKDAAGIMQPRDLTFLDPTIFRSIPNDAIFVNSGISVNNTGGYAETVKKRGIIAQGSFETSRDGSNKGLISTTGLEDLIKVIQKEAGIEYHKTDMEQAKIGGYSIVDEKMIAVNQVYMQELDTILATGTEFNEGLINYSGFTSDSGSVITSSTAGASDFEQISQLLNDQRSAVYNNVAYKSNRVVIPTSVHNIIAVKPYLPNAGTKSVLSALRESFPDVTFMASWRSEDVSGNKVITAYSSDQNAMVNRIPVPLQISQIDKSGFSFSADMFYRIAGLDVIEDSAGRHLVGV